MKEVQGTIMAEAIKLTTDSYYYISTARLKLPEVLL
jgi:hypothetical protein